MSQDIPKYSMRPEFVGPNPTRAMAEGRWILNIVYDALDKALDECAPGEWIPISGNRNPKAFRPMLKGILTAPGVRGRFAASILGDLKTKVESLKEQPAQPAVAPAAAPLPNAGQLAPAAATLPKAGPSSAAGVKQVPNPPGGTLPPPETYAQAVVRAINTAKAKQAQADKKNRAAMAKVSAEARQLAAAKKEEALRVKYAEGYIPLAQRKRVINDKKTVKAALDEGHRETIVQKTAKGVHSFVKYTASQMKAHQAAILAKTGAVKWFSAAERAAYKAMSPQAKAQSRLVQAEKAAALRKEKTVAQQELRTKMDAAKRAKEEFLAKRASCLAKHKTHHWKKDSNHPNALVRCSRCLSTPEMSEWCSAYGRHSFVSTHGLGQRCTRCGRSKPCKHNVIGPDDKCISCGEPKADAHPAGNGSRIGAWRS